MLPSCRLIGRSIHFNMIEGDGLMIEYRDNAITQTRKLQAEIQAERDAFKRLLK